MCVRVCVRVCACVGVWREFGVPGRLCIPRVVGPLHRIANYRHLITGGACGSFLNG